jgi:predicted MFS family arabinose efflux permease
MLGGAHYFTWIVVATGLGAMLGALSIGYRAQGTSMQGAALLMIGYSAALAGFAFTHVLAYALAAQFVIGWTYFAVMTSLQTLIQSIVDETKRGRVMSLFQVCWAGLIPWGGLAMGKSAAELGVTTTLGAAAGICGVYALGVWLWARGSLTADLPASEGGLY